MLSLNKARMFQSYAHATFAITVVAVWMGVILYIAGGWRQWWVYNAQITLGVLSLLSTAMFFSQRLLAMPSRVWWYQVSAPLVWVVVPLWFARAFILEPFHVPSDSMEPSIKKGDVLWVSKWSTPIMPWGSPWRHGDLVVFQDPYNPQAYMVKRLIGLPNDQLTFKGNAVTRNGRELLHIPANLDNSMYMVEDAQYVVQYEQHLALTPLYEGPACNRQGDAVRCTLGEKQYWVLGDNRNYSMDSRDYGPIAYNAIVGRVIRIQR